MRMEKKKTNDGIKKRNKRKNFFRQKGLLIFFKTNISTDFAFSFSLCFSLDDGKNFLTNFDEGLLLIEFFSFSFFFFLTSAFPFMHGMIFIKIFLRFLFS